MQEAIFLPFAVSWSQAKPVCCGSTDVRCSHQCSCKCQCACCWNGKYQCHLHHAAGTWTDEQTYCGNVLLFCVRIDSTW